MKIGRMNTKKITDVFFIRNKPETTDIVKMKIKIRGTYKRSC